MIRIKNLIYCKTEEDLEKVKEKYPYPQYRWNLYKSKILEDVLENHYPLFLMRDLHRVEIYRISPLKALLELNKIKENTRDEKQLSLCNKLIEIVIPLQNYVTLQDGPVVEGNRYDRKKPSIREERE